MDVIEETGCHTLLCFEELSHVSAQEKGDSLISYKEHRPLFNRGSLFVTGLLTAAKMHMLTYSDNLFHCSCEALFCFRSRFRRSLCFSPVQKHRKH